MSTKHRVRLFDMQFITACISTTMVLILLGLMLFLVLSAHRLSVYVRENLNFTVLLNNDAPESAILALQKRLDSEAFVKASAYISKEEALKEEVETMGSDPVEFLGYNPFSPSIELKLHAAYANADSVAWIKERILADKLVTDVDYRQGLMDSVNRNISKLSIGLLAVAALLTLISFALINNTVRLTIYSKRFLIHTMKLVGAGWGFIRRPFLRRNFWVGLSSGVLADAVLVAAAYTLVSYEPGLLAVITTDILLWVMLSTLLFGVLITCLCAYISINKYLRLSAGDLYYM
ncbi:MULTISPECIES: cell division protein FtsX [Mediterranea]|uniref:cell division protein FtsX n=1 Tax=Mediterranea TaxID=1926659 RepID=UPI0020112158|nr:MULTISPECIES: permease-like cell division protein FtsX [Mediterranea]MCL1608166.1 permease-like cell division protein FtsX [Mediterranea sp. ET5]MDM8122009.1 permease-like cell division protein FtsX [Mediterranea massiliensis]MDM8198293.1 permease-like cell division protein FtsX [Mediterranea massiliensis]